METIKIKEKDGTITEYIMDQNGVIKQLYPQRYVYDSRYISTYDSPDYERKSLALQTLRMGFILAKARTAVDTLMDVGYGNGAFLKVAKLHVPNCSGFDVTGLPVPSGCKLETNLFNGAFHTDVVTFWDCLEHFPDLSFLSSFPCNMIVVSLPWCHYSTVALDAAKDWFANWKHRKPNEHLHHFDKRSLKATMEMYGWYCIGTSNMEDHVRKGPDKLQNILTCAFSR